MQPIRKFGESDLGALQDFSLAHGHFPPVEGWTGQLADHHISLYLGVPLLLHSQEDGKKWSGELHHNDICIAPRGLTYSVTWPNPAEFLSLVRCSALFEKAAEELDARPVELITTRQIPDPQIKVLMRCLWEDQEAGSPTGRLYGDLLGLALAIRVIQRYTAFPCKPRTYLRGLSATALRRVSDYIESHLETPIRLSELAAQAGISPHYFCQLFKQSTGRSPHQHVVHRRIVRSKALLSDRRLSLAEIAYRTGFSSQAHFTGTFQKLVGVSPGKYRNGTTVALP